jgi:hypothetical protein
MRAADDDELKFPAQLVMIRWDRSSFLSIQYCDGAAARPTHSAAPPAASTSSNIVKSIRFIAAVLSLNPNNYTDKFINLLLVGP